MSWGHAISDRTSPIAPLTTQLPRATFNEFERRAKLLRTNKSALMRELVERYVATRCPAADLGKACYCTSCVEGAVR